MILYPAMDLRGGQVVRLKYGDPTQQTVYSADPLAAAERWRQAGARWLHLVNLDGALDEAAASLDLIQRIAALGLRIQFGGGLRSLEDVARVLESGVSRAVLGTLAVRQPELITDALDRFGPEAIAVALDARDGLVSVQGWQQATPFSPSELGRRFAAMGLRHALFTDINRDGAMTGVNVEATARLASDTGLQVIASGGVASLADLHALAATAQVAGAVIGRALYDGSIDLSEALTLFDERS